MEPLSDLSRVRRLSIRSADSRVELAAAAVIRRCLAGRGLNEVPVPVPVDEWIESPLGYRFEVVSEDELGPGVLGRARPSTGEIAVSESLLSHEGRFRFTCAHELGHVTLHATLEAAYSDRELPHHSTESEIEREADRFAAALLMPGDALGNALADVVESERLAPACLDLLRGDDDVAVWLWRRCVIPRLADRFGVSRAAMVYRCREVRLPGKKRLIRPKLIPMVLAPDSAVAALRLDDIRLEKGLPRRSH